MGLGLYGAGLHWVVATNHVEAPQAARLSAAASGPAVIFVPAVVPQNLPPSAPWATALPVEPEASPVRESAPTFLRAGRWVWPAQEKRITSGFGARVDPVSGASVQTHRGVDIRSECGAAVYAASGGKVLAAELTAGSGNMVKVAHAGGWVTRYLHLSRIDVAVGEVVAAGQRVGLTGSTGRTTGPHVHFEVWKNGAPRNPLAFRYQRLPAAAFVPDSSVTCLSGGEGEEMFATADFGGSFGDGDAALANLINR